jgi:hypothetical protein
MSDGTSTVVVVDDVAEVRLLVRRHLDRSGQFTVVGEGADGRAAVELARDLRPELLLLDVSMPEMDGLEALPQIRAAAPDTIVVMYTGFDEVGLADRARALGATALIEKSAAVGQLAGQLEAIRRDATGGSEHSAASEPVSVDDAGEDTVLGEHLERFREVFEEAAIGMATMTLTGTIVRANKALAALVGHRVRDLAGLSYASLAIDRHRAGVVRALHDAQHDAGRIVQFEHASIAAGGSLRLLATAAPVKDGQERPLYLFLQLQDVTAQRGAEEELRQSEERFRLLVEAVEDYAIFMLDPTGTVISWNTGAQRTKGYTSEEIIGRHFRVFYPDAVQAVRHPEHELRLAIDQGHYEEEGWRIRKDGSRFWASVVITAIRNRDGEHIGFAKVTRNIDERRQLQSDLENTAAELAGTNLKLGAANSRLAGEAADQAEFLAVTAHELRTPVSVLSGSAGLLVDHWAQMTEGDRAELFESITTSAARLQRLLNDLLTASRLEARTIHPQLQSVDLGDVLAHAVAAARAATDNADIRFSGPPALPVLGEPDRLAQAVENLLGNAVRHGTPPVIVRTRTVGDRVEIEVSDAGPGVDPTVESRLFQRFVSGRRGGTGLGLFIVRELARAYGGDAWYRPKDDAAPVRFVVSLVAAGAAVDPAGTAES